MDIFDSASEQEQKDTQMALRQHRKANTTLFVVSALECRECGHDIPEARRVASQGCQYCIGCQTLKESGKR